MEFGCTYKGSTTDPTRRKVSKTEKKSGANFNKRKIVQ